MPKDINKQNITYEMRDKGKLTDGDKKILELAEEIEKGTNVFKKIKKASKIRKILMKTIVRKFETIEETLIILQHVLLYGSSPTLQYIIEKDKQYKFFEEIADKVIISQYFDDYGNPIVKTYSTIVCQNSTVRRRTFSVDILTEIRANSEKAKNFSIETVTEKQKDTDTLLEVIEGALGECKKVSDVKKQSNNTVDQDAEIELCKNVSQDSENPQSVNKNSKDNQNTLKEQKSSIPKSLFSELCNKSCTENSEDEKLSRNLPKSIASGIVVAGLLASCIMLYVMKTPVISVAIGIVGLTCAGFALHNLLKPKTKFEEVKDVEQYTAQPLLNLLC